MVLPSVRIPAKAKIYLAIALLFVAETELSLAFGERVTFAIAQK